MYALSRSLDNGNSFSIMCVSRDPNALRTKAQGAWDISDANIDWTTLSWYEPREGFSYTNNVHPHVYKVMPIVNLDDL